ncbi:amino acid adenylation domain-containing protein [Streptomyces sp. NA04227]|uniref:non-ribosomal peptide synthetase n=1 Tax=Streptomyces sp. NA04227 TaxID=2742136 RepID=UPI0015921D2E|nr:non-ribosomal peptide synthetase [Streptomyces sp. NA04227]QKW09061.1 amino acid adenylation domain-containing protein [Streptomyces sp. NA04227]
MTEQLTTLLDDLAEARVRLRAEGEELKVSAAKGALTPDLRERLRAGKARLLAHLRAEAALNEPVKPLPREGRDTEGFPLSDGQQALWLLDRLEGGEPTYVLSGGVRLTGELRTDLLIDCLGLLAGRHEALRTAFRPGPGGEVRAFVLPPAELEVRRSDLSQLPAGEREEALERLVHASSREAFDLTEGRLLRATLIRTGEQSHYLLLSVHHIAADAPSLAVLLRELFRLYEGGAEPTTLPPLSVQHADVADWQRRSLSPATEERQLSYWKEQLEGAPVLLEMPADRTRPARQSFRGGAVRFTFDTATTALIQEAAGRAHVTAYTVVLSCWAAALARHAHAEEVVVGTPVSNRERPEAASVVGFFVGTLPLRVDLSGEPSFHELLGRTQRTFLEGFEYRAVPFQQVVAELAPRRSASHAPVFQNMLTYYESPHSDLSPGELRAEAEDVHNGTAKFDLTLFAEDRGDSLVCTLEYASDLFDEDTVRRLADSFRELTAAALREPGTPVSRLPLITAEQRTELLAGRNATDRPVDLDRPVHTYVTEQAARRPEAVAVRFGTRELTYAELEERANRLAHTLRSKGAGPDVPVGLHTARSVRQLVAMLAILKAGAALLPLDPTHPAERTTLMLQESSCPLVLSDSALDTPEGVRVLLLDELDSSGEELTPPEVVTGRDNLIYVLYTSGSTGRPKGVAMRHGALANLLDWQAETFPFTEDDRVLQFSALNFDVSVQEIFATWAAGASLVLVDQDTRRDALRLLPYLQEHGVTRLFLPFVALQQLAEVADAKQSWPESLREVFTAGEQLHVTEELRTFFTRTGAALHNQYGPSESHVITSHTLPGTPDGWESLPPIGRAVGNTRIYLLDRHDEPVPQGVAGELCVAGDCLAAGYLHRDDLTAERFVADPFRPGERMYRTGDLARYRADGEIDFVGRMDNQVKIRGFRVELGEIEAVLLRHPGVAEAVVEPRRIGAGRELVAWLVAAESGLPDAAALREHCARALPDYMLPSRIVRLDAMPTTLAGKVARLQLPTPEPEDGAASGAEPSTPTEKSVAQVFADILGVGQVAADANFFDLGGHSLGVTRAALRLSEEHGVEITAQIIFENPTVAGVARSLDTLGWAVSAPRAAATDDDAREEGEL